MSIDKSAPGGDYYAGGETTPAGGHTYDSDGDGVADQVGYDTNGDGYDDTYNVDTNGDQWTDTTVTDFNGAGWADSGSASVYHNQYDTGQHSGGSHSGGGSSRHSARVRRPPSSCPSSLWACRGPRSSHRWRARRCAGNGIGPTWRSFARRGSRTRGSPSSISRAAPPPRCCRWRPASSARCSRVPWRWRPSSPVPVSAG